MRRWLARLVLLLFSCAVTGGLAEAICRWRDVGPRYALDQFGCEGIVVRLDPSLLFRVVPTPARPDINRQGFRDHEFGPKRGKRRLLFLGDSFVMGNNVPADQTLPKQLERRLPDWEVLNMGVLGYGPDQSLLRLQAEGLPLRPDAVVLSVFAANDFSDLSKNETLDVSGLLRWRLPLLLRRAVTGRFFPPEVEDPLIAALLKDKTEMPPTPHQKELLRATLERYRDLHLDLRVVVLPCFENIQDDTELRARGGGDYFANEKAAEELCEQVGLPFVSLREEFLRARSESLYDPRDRHLSVAGCRKAAEVLARSYR